MMNTDVLRILKSMLLLGLFGALLAGVLLSEWIGSAGAPGWLRMVGVEIQAACRDAGTQWMVVVCLVSYFVAFVVLEKRILPQENAENAKAGTASSTPHPGPLPVRGGEGGSIAPLVRFCGKNSDAWLWVFVSLVLVRYAVSYESASKSLQVVVLLTGIVIGKGISFWVAASRRFKVQVSSFKSGETGAQPLTPSLSPSDGERVAEGRVRGILYVLVLLLACASQWQPEYGMEFQYRGQRRWTGPWDNPNIYGLMMGVGAVLAVGLFFSKCSKFRVSSSGFQVSSRSSVERHLTGNPHPQPLSTPQTTPHPACGHLLPIGCGEGTPLGEGGVGLSPDEAERVGDAASVGGASVLASRLVSSLAPPGVTPPTDLRSRVWCVSWLRARRFLLSAFLLFAFVLCAFGLLKSYSRGAWLGTAVGLGFLICTWTSRTHLTPSLSPRPTGGEGETSEPSSINHPSSTSPKSPRVSWLRTNLFPLSVFLLSVFVLCFWQFRHTEIPIARRIFSVGNPNDFSWRNRVATWGGAVTMMADRPLAGHGWGSAETVFREKYKPVHLEDSAAIQMNDYLMLGISCGVLALVCLLIYIGLVLRWSAPVPGRSGVALQSCGGKEQALQSLDVAVPEDGHTPVGTVAKMNLRKETGNPSPGLSATLSPSDGERDGVRGDPEIIFGKESMRGVKCGVNEPSTINFQPTTVAISGAIVLLIGFWFDGGLFKLATCVVFWVLVELARGESVTTKYTKHTKSGQGMFSLFFRVVRVFRGSNQSETDGDSSRRHLPLDKWQMSLRVVAGFVLAWAAGVTALHLGVPQLTVSDTTLSIARKYLVTQKQKNDFEFLAAMYQSGITNPLTRSSTTLSPSGGERDGVRGTTPHVVAYKSIWSGQRLKSLLTHVELANYNRELVNWKLEDQMYREFVLSPVIVPEQSPSRGLSATLSPSDGERDGVRGGPESISDRRSGSVVTMNLRKETGNPSPGLPATLSPLSGDTPHPASGHLLPNAEKGIVAERVAAPSTDLNWRRELWENFYPRIRKESSIEAAAEIIIRNVNAICKRQGGRNSKLEIQNGKVEHNQSIADIWRQQTASDDEFERIYVAALRSVGIPSRLDAQRRAEFWNGAEWKRAPIK